MNECVRVGVGGCVCLFVNEYYSLMMGMHAYVCVYLSVCMRV